VVASSVLLFDIGSGDSTPIAEVKTDSFNALHGSAGNGAVVASAIDANGQVISTWASDGKGAIERYSPPVALDGSAQFFGSAVLSADGKKLAWLEGPDPSKKGSKRKGSWMTTEKDLQAKLILGSGYPIIGSYDDAVEVFQKMADLGLDGVAIGLINYIDDMPHIRDEILPRMERVGLRAPYRGEALG
jgi:hypothetical protein